MTAGWFARARLGDQERATLESSYECSHCRAVVDEWTEDCPRCGGLVVRVVEPAGRRPAGP